MLPNRYIRETKSVFELRSVLRCGFERKKTLKSLYISTKCSTLHDLFTTVKDKLSNLTAIKEKVTNLENNLGDISEQLTQQRRNALISNSNNHQNTILRISFILKSLLFRMIQFEK